MNLSQPLTNVIVSSFNALASSQWLDGCLALYHVSGSTADITSGSLLDRIRAAGGKGKCRNVKNPESQQSRCRKRSPTYLRRRTEEGASASPLGSECFAYFQAVNLFRSTKIHFNNSSAISIQNLEDLDDER
jgi:hypothetical protein